MEGFHEFFDQSILERVAGSAVLMDSFHGFGQCCLQDLSCGRLNQMRLVARPLAFGHVLLTAPTAQGNCSPWLAAHLP
jgi:hypothetical protein